MIGKGQITFEEVHRQEENAEKEKEKLDNIAKKAQRVIFRLKTVFPFDLFPDEIIIDEEKITLIFREFFGSGQVFSILYKDLSDVSIQATPFFSSLTLVDSRYKENPIIIRYLDKNDAVKARRIIQGILISKELGVDLSKIPLSDLKDKFEEIAKTTETGPAIG